jgi:hypothetical protein
MSIEPTLFPKLDIPMKPGTFIFHWWGWKDFYENLNVSHGMEQNAGDMAVGWIMGDMLNGVRNRLFPPRVVTPGKSWPMTFQNR